MSAPRPTTDVVRPLRGMSKVDKQHVLMSFSDEAWLGNGLAEFESALDSWVPGDAPAGLGQAMRYGVLDGGKRLRPLLVRASAEAVNGHAEAALRAAVAVELIHAYSLVHDDMPCMDNDVLRRGKATVHVRFGEAGAMLAGDAMQALAFEVLTPDPSVVPAELQACLCALLARAAGHAGMAGGQAIDLASIGKPLDETQLRDMHRRKTGALLQASVLMGAATGSLSATAKAALSDYGAALGLAFQIVDDILDVTQASDKLGKTAGKDLDANKPTYVTVLGIANARTQANALREQALAALARARLDDASRLIWLADMVVDRDC